MTPERPTLTTSRLLLRPFALTDAPAVQRLAGDRHVYATTLTIPHPYEDGMAEAWIATHADTFAVGRGLTLAITTRDEDTLLGAISIGMALRHRRGELGYWIGLPYWGNGYCTEAAAALVGYAFKYLDAHKITSRHMEQNPASGRVMVKLGMTREGLLADEVWKDGRFHNLVVYGLLRAAWEDHPAHE